MKKQLPTDGITSELSRSVFFQKRPAAQPESADHSPPPLSQESRQAMKEENKQAGMTDVMGDVMTSPLPDVDLKQWQEIIENTETQNSALRLTSAERYAIEDAISELRRKYSIKTSMNEVARLGLLVMLNDFKKHKKDSLIHKVKKA
jgi:hypothetical protein